MNTKLNYTVNFDKDEKKKPVDLKAKTKLSMQATVHSALASTQPTNPAAAGMSNPQTQNGWGRAM